MFLREKLGEFIGILLGDGCIGRYHCSSPEGDKVQHRIKVTLSADEYQYSSYVYHLFCLLLGKTPVIREKNDENAIDISLFDKKRYQYLVDTINMHSGPKEQNAQVPALFDSSVAVLRGYFDTDGCIAITDNNGYAYPRVELKIMPAPMQDQLLSLIETTNIPHGVYDIGNGHVRVQMNGEDCLKQFVETIKPVNKRHLDKIKEFIAGARFERATSGYPRSYNTIPVERPNEVL